MAPVSGGLGTTPVTGCMSQFSGGALTGPSASKSKLCETTSNPVVPTTERPVLHPTEQYKVRNNGEYKLPGSVLKESKPLGAQVMTPAQKLKGWDAVPVDKPSVGSKMVIRATGAAKSKWSVPPRPAAPPPLPLNATLQDQMKVSLDCSDASLPATAIESYDLVQCNFPSPKGTIKWRMELKCQGWTRAIGVVTETSTAAFKIARAAEKKLEVRGATVDKEGRCSLWTAWVPVPQPEALAEEAAKEAAKEAAGGEEAGGAPAEQVASVANTASPPDATAEANASRILQLEEALSLLTDRLSAAETRAAEAEARAESAEARASAAETRVAQAVAAAEVAGASEAAARLFNSDSMLGAFASGETQDSGQANEQPTERASPAAAPAESAGPVATDLD
jgi:hypothetical protein